MTTPIGFIDCAVQMTNEGDPEPYFCTHGSSWDSGSQTMQEAADNVFLSFVDGWRSEMPALVTLDKAICRFGSDGADVVVESSNVPVAGTGTGARLPQNCAALVTKNTGLGGRQFKGRCYVPGVLQEDQVSATGAIVPAFVVTLQAAAQAWFDGLAFGAQGSVPLTPTPMHLLHSPPLVGPTPAPTPVLALVVDAVIATQRRRLRR